MTLEQINDFMWNNKEKLQNYGISCYNWVVIDTIGLETGTCLVTERVYESGDNDQPSGHGKRSRACRLPYEQAWGMYCNLDIANMGFEEWVDEDAGIQSDGTWKWVGPFPASNEISKKIEDRMQARREQALQAMKKLGHVE